MTAVAQPTGGTEEGADSRARHAEGTALVRSPDRALRILRPVAQPAEMIAAQNASRAFIADVLEEGKDWGKIAGVQKPTLLKPGAEKVTLGFGCTAVPRILDQEVDHDRVVRWVKVKKMWSGKRGERTSTEEKQAGESLGLYRYIVQVDIVDERGEIRGSGIGSCSTMESKYVDRPRDCENTVVKMATKRAHVAAVLSTFGLSEQFTQDVEETGVHAAEEAAPAPVVSPLDRTWPRWPNFPYAGAKMRDIPTSVLEKQHKSITRSVEKAKQEKEQRVVDMGEKLLETIAYVLEDRRTNPTGAPAEPAPATAMPTAAAGASLESDLNESLTEDDLPF